MLRAWPESSSSCCPWIPAAACLLTVSCPCLQINLTESSSSTLPFENGRQIRTIAVSPDGRILASGDASGRLILNRL